MSQVNDDVAAALEEVEPSSARWPDDKEGSAGAKRRDEDREHDEGSKPASDTRDPLQIMYDKVATQHDRIDDFRAKLLALLPIATGVGLFALVKDTPPATNDLFLFAIGIFGAISSFGLFVHELRGITECYMLIKLGAALEYKLIPGAKRLRGAFYGRNRWGFAGYISQHTGNRETASHNMVSTVAKTPTGTSRSGSAVARSHYLMRLQRFLQQRNIVSRETAALIIYSTTVAAWVFVAFSPLLGWLSLVLSFLVLAAVVWWGLQSLRWDARRASDYINRIFPFNLDCD